MNSKCYYLVSGTLFALVALAHLLRIIFNLTISINDTLIPMWISGIGCIIPALLAVWAFRLVNGKNTNV
ncbi:hypothetical protein [Thalassotalea insulae]|uniref:hypothetical protein n=1 Tax=Thalassotalea insulae TaxID=2056778 RepID=UPI0024E0AFE0|nr:hypothetical protein [Thalassotalea insulae]